MSCKLPIFSSVKQAANFLWAPTNSIDYCRFNAPAAHLIFNINQIYRKKQYSLKMSLTETNIENKMAETKSYTVEELKEHTTEEDCWLAIHGKVYNVTEFLDEHPGEN